MRDTWSVVSGQLIHQVTAHAVILATFTVSFSVLGTSPMLLGSDTRLEYLVSQILFFRKI